MMKEIITFYLCGNLYGIDVARSKEICRNIKPVSIPGVPDYVAGFINLRGQVVTILDLAKILNRLQDNQLPIVTCIILKLGPNDTDQLGVIIDKMGNVIKVDDAMCEIVPSHLNTIDRQFIREVVKLNEEIVLVLNMDKLLEL